MIGGYFVFIWPNIENFEISDAHGSELNRLWQEEYSRDFRFSDNWEKGSFNCLSQESGMVQGLHLLAKTNFHTPDDVEQIDFYKWVQNLDLEFDVRPMLRLAGRSEFATRHVFMNSIVLAENNPVEIANIIIHEARHIEEGFNSHVVCIKDTERLCDQRLEADPSTGGAYNYNVLFLHHIRQYSDASAQNKRRAKKLMQEIFDGRFNSVNPDDRTKYGLD
ncbi:MAG: hypothetical protein AAGA76_11525 [Pseudomonadota bacterium]